MAIFFHAGHTFGGTSPNGKVRLDNPYEKVDWENFEYLHSFSHQHTRDPQLFWDMGYRHLPISNYYPSRPTYPLPEAFAEKYPEALGAPNAEQHSTTDAGIHFCVPGSFYTTGYGQSPRVKLDASPVEAEFSDLNVFDAENSPWLGVYRLDLRMAAVDGSDQEPEVKLTIEGAEQVDRKTFEVVGDGVVRQQNRTSKTPNTIYLRTQSDTIRVRLDFDPESTQITLFRLMQGTNRPWRDAFRAALDGTLKDEKGQPIEGLQYPDAGGITINHPTDPLERILEMLDFDPRVLGIEVWNERRAFGGTDMRFYRLWDEVLRTGRRCLGFFVKDHIYNRRGRNVLLVSWPETATHAEREREALRAYREGRFFGLLGAIRVDESGEPVPPYDQSDFRFTRIDVRKGENGEPAGVEVRVDGADLSKRPQTQIRFITDEGVARVENSDRAYFEFPVDSEGTILCRYVRVEAFSYPETHLGGEPLTADTLATMNIHELSRIHDRIGPFERSLVDASGETPVPIVEMLFSQPIRILPDR